MTYSPPLALDLALDVQKAYRDADDGATTINEKGAECNVHTGVDPETGERHMRVIAPGTRSIGDWVANLMLRRVKSKHGGRVQWGWRRQARRINGPLLRRLAGTNQPLVLAAHSLGCPVINQLTLDCRAIGYPVQAVYLFNTPRPGNAEFETAYDSTLTGLEDGSRLFDVTHRVTHTDRGVPDAVTRVRSRWAGGRHVGQPVLIDGEYRYESFEAWHEAMEENPIGLVAEWRIFTKLITGIGTHSIGSLIRDLRVQAKEVDIE